MGNKWRWGRWKGDERQVQIRSYEGEWRTGGDGGGGKGIWEQVRHDGE